MVTKKSLQNILKQHILEINFKKTDGTNRTMICSLKKDYIPVVESTETPKRVKKENPEVLAVWDLEKEAFRSFRIENLVDYQIIEEGYEL